MEGFRDPGVKLDKGVSKSSGDVIAFADSDIAMQPRWLARGVAALLAQGGGVEPGACGQSMTRSGAASWTGTGSARRPRACLPRIW